MTEAQIKTMMAHIEREITAKAQQAQLPAAERTVEVMATPGAAIVRT